MWRSPGPGLSRLQTRDGRSWRMLPSFSFCLAGSWVLFPLPRCGGRGQGCGTRLDLRSLCLVPPGGALVWGSGRGSSDVADTLRPLPCRRVTAWAGPLPRWCGARPAESGSARLCAVLLERSGSFAFQAPGTEWWCRSLATPACALPGVPLQPPRWCVLPGVREPLGGRGGEEKEALGAAPAAAATARGLSRPASGAPCASVGGQVTSLPVPQTPPPILGPVPRVGLMLPWCWGPLCPVRGARGGWRGVARLR